MSELIDDADDEIIAKVSDYLDGVLPPDEKSTVEAKLKTDPAYQRVHAEMQETRDALSGLHKARAKDTFVEDVTGLIHKRSAGRFFGRRTLGDRVPFGLLLILAVIALAALAMLLRSSMTGSL